MCGFVYLWHDTLRKKFCVGSRVGNPDDGYVTSTGHMLRAYKKRPHTFRRRILQTVDGTKKEVREAEQRWLDMIKEDELGTRYYNLKKYAIGGKTMSFERQSEIMKRVWQDRELRLKRSEISKHVWKELEKRCDGEGENTGSLWAKKMQQGNTVLQCPHCGKEARKNVYVQWHGDMCKENPDADRYALKARREQLALARINSPRTKKGKSVYHGKPMPKRTCPHCDFTGASGGMTRWHFGNCRMAK